MTTPHRKLLDTKGVAEKLSCSTTSFKRKQAQLEAEGFPPPCLNRDLYGTARWDEAAIDLWLDARMDPSLLSLRDTAQNVAATMDMTNTLKQRAEALALS